MNTNNLKKLGNRMNVCYTLFTIYFTFSQLALLNCRVGFFQPLLLLLGTKKDSQMRVFYILVLIMLYER
jgi:hypothetical protein